MIICVLAGRNVSAPFVVICRLDPNRPIRV